MLLLVAIDQGRFLARHSVRWLVTKSSSKSLDTHGTRLPRTAKLPLIVAAFYLGHAESAQGIQQVCTDTLC